MCKKTTFSNATIGSGATWWSNFQLHTDICAKHLGWKHFSVYQRQHFQISPDMFAKYLGVETYLWDVYKTQLSQFAPQVCAADHFGG